MPKVSVLLPVRNGALSLRKALGSLWQQNFRDFEVVVVNDGSTDGTIDILHACKDKRLKLIQQPGQGIAAALNKGLQYCAAPLVARMDADDVCHPQRLEKQWNYMQQNQEVDVLACCVDYGGEQESSKGYFLYVQAINELLSHEQMSRRRFWDAPLAHPSVMFRKEVVLSAGGYSMAPVPEDYELWLRLFERGHRFAKLPDVLLTWNDHPVRLSRTHPNYHKKAFWQLKASYMFRHLKSTYGDKLPAVYLWGETKKKSRSRYLLEEGLSVSGRIGNTGAEGQGIIPYTQIPCLKECIILVYVSNRTGRQQIIRFLEEHDFIEGKNYFLMV